MTGANFKFDLFIFKKITFKVFIYLYSMKSKDLFSKPCYAYIALQRILFHFQFCEGVSLVVMAQLCLSFSTDKQ